MLIRMRLARTFQDVGRERYLAVGETYDVPDVVAAALIATGAAEHAEPELLAPPETKPDAPPETKAAPGPEPRGSRRAS